MAIDYDTPRAAPAEELAQTSLEELTGRHSQSGVIDTDDADLAEEFELPGADLSGEELAVRIVPRRADEFVCSKCFLIRHRGQLASTSGGELTCTECAS